MIRIQSPALRCCVGIVLTNVLAASISAPASAAPEDFVHFESAQVHPLALSADGTRLYALNTPDNRLSVFDVGADGSLELDAEFVVGLEPVSLAVRGEEVWVVNHISDSVSVIDMSERKLVATIRTGDEPTDIVFANGRAFVSMAGARDQVKVYDAATRAEVAQIDVPGDDPRALAASADGNEVYLVILESGNRTTTIDPTRDGGTSPPPDPPRTPGLRQPPATNLIVQFNASSGLWEDEYGTPRGDETDLDVPDEDVFVIDTATPGIVRTVRSVGTTLYDVAVRPGTGELVVANTDARSLIRFEPNLRGHFVDTRLTSVEPDSGARMHLDLNPHIDFDVSPGPQQEIDASIAIPGDIEFTSDGSACYLASFGSAKVAVIDPSDGSVDFRIAVGGGPSGLALAESLHRLYVLNRFDNTISIVDTVSRAEVGRTGIAGPSGFDPSPEVVRSGRRLLYDATATSGHGDSACASCHVFGNFDGIAWDLGDPTGDFLLFINADWAVFAPPGPTLADGFHPMKGPMVTQTLRGLEGMEPFHWRGDRRDFQHFNGAFVSLMGLDAPLADEEMDLFADFAMTIRMPPNPNRTLDDQLPPTIAVMQFDGFGASIDADPALGEDLYFNAQGGDPAQPCVACHTVPNGTSNLLNAPTFLMPQVAKIAQLRNLYEKVGFGRVANLGPNSGAPTQKSGFGILHDGIASLSEFLLAYFLSQPVTMREEENLVAFLMAFPSGTPPCVGHQLTLDFTNAHTPDADAEISRMLGQAALGNCDVVVHGVVDGQEKSFAFDVALDAFVTDSRQEAPLDDASLRASLVDGDIVTYLTVPAGSGARIGIDRDRDTWRNADELVDGSDAADPDSTPPECRGEGEPMSRARLALRTSRVDADADVLSLRGRVDLSGRQDPPVDLVATGVIVSIRDANGDVLFRSWIRPGALEQRGTDKWRLGEPVSSEMPGLDRADFRLKEGVFGFRLRAQVAGIDLEEAAFPLDVAAVFGTFDQNEAGQCGRTEFESAGCRIAPERSACR